MTEPPFNTVLAAFRTSIEARPDDDHRKSILKILDRWRDDRVRQDELWEGLEQILPLRPPAGFFIASVILSRRTADELKRVSEGLPGLKEMASDIENEWTSPDGDYIAAGIKKKVLAGLERDVEHVLGRQRADAAKRRFIEHWSDHFREHTGKPADKLVAIITDIAFGGEHTTEDVRNALKFRKRRDRDTRKQK